MGTAGAKAFGEMLQANKTLTSLDVSDNSFGMPQKGDFVKLLSSGEMCTVYQANDDGRLWLTKPDGSRKDYVKPSEFEWESCVPAFAAGLAANASLSSVSNVLVQKMLLLWFVSQNLL